ncbi:hypothetical protein PVAP13_5KG117374 [Panicum virgatum]|uniref:Uncharacterized protein n=1 Tax=Panicum virgatum TaxID=38727 RepID=A0A8T0SCD9_PANVG|nr:hypothetical protein PVAP13_5KG117374 [Panicum virgatum]
MLPVPRSCPSSSDFRLVWLQSAAVNLTPEREGKFFLFLLRPDSLPHRWHTTVHRDHRTTSQISTGRAPSSSSQIERAAPRRGTYWSNPRRATPTPMGWAVETKAGAGRPAARAERQGQPVSLPTPTATRAAPENDRPPSAPEELWTGGAISSTTVARIGSAGSGPLLRCTYTRP